MPTVLNVPNAGDLSVAPVVRLQPTGQRGTRTANVGWSWRVRYTITNGAARALANHPVAISLGATNALVSGSKALASGNDLRVALDGREVARTLVGWNTGATACWVVVPWIGPGASLTYDVLYGNPSAGSPPVLAYPQLPAFDLATSSNTKWSYLVDRTAGNAGLGGWYLSDGANPPAVLDQSGPGAWQTARTLYNEDDAAQDTVSTYTASGTKYQGRFAAARGRGGSLTGPYRNVGDGVAITVPAGIASVRCDLKWLNPQKGGSGTDPVGQLVILTSAGEGAGWATLYGNAATAATETTVATATYTPAAAVQTVAFAVWPFDGLAVDPTATSVAVARANWNSVLELNLVAGVVTQATAQAETAVYEIAAEVLAQRDGRGDGVVRNALRLGNQPNLAGAGTPRLTLALSQWLVVDTMRRVPEVWDSGRTALVETLSPAAASAVDGVLRGGAVVEQAAGWWLPLTATANPLANPSFDGGVSGWSRGTVTAGQTVAAQAQDTGVYDTSPGSLKTAVTASTAGIGAVVEDRADDLLPVAGRARVWVAAAVRSSSANLQPTLTVWFYDAAGSPVGSGSREADWTVPANTWVRRVWSADVPAGATQFRVGATCKSKAANQTGTVWVDTVTVCDNDLTLSEVATGTVTAAVEWAARYA